MASQGLVDFTSSAPRQVSRYGFEPQATNAPPLVWYEELGDEQLAISVSYLLSSEFPWFKEGPSHTPSDLREQTDSFSAAIERNFAQMVSEIPEVERVLIRKDLDYMRIWTVIRDTDVNVEDRIYDAQLAFMDKFSDIPCDFSVIFRQDLDPAAINPLNAQALFRR